MAISAPIKTSDFSGFLNPEMSAPIFNEAARQSVVQQLVRRVPLGINGQSIPVVTGKPTANWVGETDTKHTTDFSMGLKTIEPKKLTAIAVLSAEVVRANPGGVNEELRNGLAGAFATAFDYATLHDVNGLGTGSGPFTDAVTDTNKSVALGTATQQAGGIHADVNAALAALVNDGKKLRGFAFDDTAEPLFWGAVDSTGRPLYVDLPTDDAAALVRPGRLLNRPSFMGEGVGLGDVVGFAGDWTKAAWGVVGGISYRVSTEAAVTINNTLVSLFEKNLVAVLAEAEYGWVMADVNAFVKFTAPGQASS